MIFKLIPALFFGGDFFFTVLQKVRIGLFTLLLF